MNKLRLEIKWADGRVEDAFLEKGEGLAILVGPEVESFYLSHDDQMQWNNVVVTKYGNFISVTPYWSTPEAPLGNAMLIQPTWHGTATYFMHAWACRVCHNAYRTQSEAEFCSLLPLPLPPKFQPGDIIEGIRSARYVVDKVRVFGSSTGHHVEYQVRTLVSGMRSFLPGTTEARLLKRIGGRVGWRKAARELLWE